MFPRGSGPLDLEDRKPISLYLDGAGTAAEHQPIARALPLEGESQLSPEDEPCIVCLLFALSRRPSFDTDGRSGRLVSSLASIPPRMLILPSNSAAIEASVARCFASSSILSPRAWLKVCCQIGNQDLT